jgi:hypothetical protein
LRLLCVIEEHSKAAAEELWESIDRSL